MEKIFRMITYSFGSTRPRLDTGGILIPSGIEVKAKVDMETGEVKLFIDESDLEELKNKSSE